MKPHLKRERKSRQEEVGQVLQLLELRQGDVAEDEAVEIAGFSGRHFRRVFRQITGTSFRDAQLQARLAPARLEVRSRQRSISKIAERFGYKRRAKFDQSYERAFRITPARDRN